MGRRLPPLEPPLGPFTRGYNDAMDARLLPADAAVQAINADLTTGALKAMFGPGTGTASGISGIVAPDFGAVDAAYNWFAVPANNEWIGAQIRQHLCLDTDEVAYCTDIDTGSIPGTGRAIYNPGAAGFDSYRLGVVAPTSGLTVVNGAGGGARAYAVVLVTQDGLETNPYPVLGTLPADVPAATKVTDLTNAVLTIPVGAGDARWAARNIYATQADDVSGTKYLLLPAAGGRSQTLADNTTTTLTDGVNWVLDLDSPLTWSPGGYIDNDVLTYDHAPWPSPLVLSNQLHGATPGAGGGGSGILFGTDDSGFIARWSMVGFPQFCPAVNAAPLPEPVQAIVSHGFETLYLLPSQIWSFTGVADYAIDRAKTAAERGVRVGCGHTAVRTPWGVLALARDGFFLADGRAPLLTHGVLEPRALNALTFRGACYYDGFYFAFHTTGTIILDMREFPERLRITTSDVVALGAWVNNYDFPNLVPGMYVMTTRGQVRKWAPAETVSGATRGALTWRTPKLTWGRGDRLKGFTKFRVDGTGAATFDFYRDDETTAAFTKIVPDIAKKPWFWLGPKLARARALSVKVTSADGTASIVRMEPEGAWCGA